MVYFTAHIRVGFGTVRAHLTVICKHCRIENWNFQKLTEFWLCEATESPTKQLSTQSIDWIVAQPYSPCAPLDFRNMFSLSCQKFQENHHQLWAVVAAGVSKRGKISVVHLFVFILYLFAGLSRCAGCRLPRCPIVTRKSQRPGSRPLPTDSRRSWASGVGTERSVYHHYNPCSLTAVKRHCYAPLNWSPLKLNVNGI